MKYDAPPWNKTVNNLTATSSTRKFKIVTFVYILHKYPQTKCTQQIRQSHLEFLFWFMRMSRHTLL